MSSHSPERRANISAGLKRAIAEGRARPPVAPKGYRRERHRRGCGCNYCAKRREQAAAQCRGRSYDSDKQAANARRRAAWENREAAKLVAAGFEVFYPHAVCDRVAIKDGVAYFVEFKQPGQALRPAQEKTSAAAGDSYVVIYSDIAGVA